MGWNTVAVILNDSLGAIESDPAFGKRIADAVRNSFGREGDFMVGEVDARGERSVHCSAMRIISQCHADGEQVTITHGNLGRRADDANDLGWMALDQMQRCLERHGYKVTKPKRAKAPPRQPLPSLPDLGEER
jgi:hypothetical protein